MLFDSTFRNYLAQRPAAVMMRATLEHIFAAEAIDELFDRTAQRQYTEELTFSTVVALLEAVVFRRHPSVRSAYTHSTTDIPVSLSSLYEKLNHTEPGLAEELVRHTATRLRAVAECWPTEADPVAGLRLKQLDGNYLAGTDARSGRSYTFSAPQATRRQLPGRHRPPVGGVAWAWGGGSAGSGLGRPRRPHVIALRPDRLRGCLRPGAVPGRSGFGVRGRAVGQADDRW